MFRTNSIRRGARPLLGGAALAAIPTAKQTSGVRSAPTQKSNGTNPGGQGRTEIPPAPPARAPGKGVDPGLVAGGLVAVWLLLALRARAIRRRRKLWTKPASRLDRVLFSWSPQDDCTVRDLLNGGLCILGRSGSGKTSSSGKQIGRALLRHPNSGGLILAAKPDDLAMWRTLFREARRADDLLVFGPGKSLRFNFLDYARKSGEHTREITRTLTVIGESLRSSDTRGGENADFFEAEQTRMLYNAIEIVKAAHGRLNPWDLQRFIADAAASPTQVRDPDWQTGFHFQTLWTVFRAPKTPVEQHDHDLARLYWLSELPAMNDRTRTSITTGVFGLLHVFNTGIVRSLVSDTTNVSPDDMFRGKWILINMPPAEFGDSGRFVNAGWKYLTQRAVLRRHATPADAINVIWADEYQQFVSSFDAHYLAQCRSHQGAMVVLTQSLHGLFSTLKGETGKSQTHMLLTNFHTKIVHALGDTQTAEWASGLIGRSRQTYSGGSLAPPKDVWEAVTGAGQYTGSFSEQLAHVLEPHVFINNLRTGGPASGNVCDAIVIRSGEPFASGQNWLPVTFAQ